MLHIKCFTFNPFQENTYLLYDEEGNATLIDPGCHAPEEKKELEAFVLDQNLKVSQLLNTHCHIDHVLGNAWAMDRFLVPLHIQILEVPVLKSVEVYAPNYGFRDYVPSQATSYLVEGQEIYVGKEKIRCIFVPGHAPGHLAFYHEESRRCIAGDALFRGSIGRTDLPGGNHSLLMDLIMSHLFILHEETVTFPGHLPETTIVIEKKNKPFVGLKAKP